LQAELIRAALVADHAREVSLRPSALRTVLASWTLTNPLVRQAVFGAEQVYERWTMVAQAMEQAEKRHTPLFTALSLQAPLQGERAGEVQCAPVTLACFMSDPVTARALAGALQRPRTLGESGIAQRLRAESIEEMQHEQVTSQW